MNQSKWPVRLASGALVCLTLAGVALAAGQQGTQADPLVSLSYLNQQATPSILAQVDAKIAQREAELQSRLAAVVDGYVKEVEDKLRTGRQFHRSGRCRCSVSGGYPQRRTDHHRRCGL